MKKIILSVIKLLVSLWTYPIIIIPRLRGIVFEKLSNYTETIVNGQLKIKLYCPNLLNQFRKDSYFTKEPEMLGWVDQFENNTVFYDIGANIGLYSIYAAKTKNCQVLSFEPSVFNLELLAKNVFANDCQANTTIVPLALNNENSIANFNLQSTELGGALSTFDKTFTHDGSEMNVSFSYKTLGMKLDEFVSFYKLPFPNYIKIDVDGLEHIILEGAINILQNRSLRQLYIEVNENFEKQYNNINKIMSDCGFSLAEKRHSDTIQWTAEFENTYNQMWVR